MKTRVIIKMEDGEPIAFFPEHAGSMDPGTCACYRRLGQHGHACTGYAAGLKPAKPHQYAPLIRELVRIGYDLEIVRKFRPVDLETRRDATR